MKATLVYIALAAVCIYIGHGLLDFSASYDATFADEFIASVFGIGAIVGALACIAMAIAEIVKRIR